MNYYKILDDNTNHLVRVVASGEFDLMAASDLLAKSYARSTELGYNILIDLREITTSVCEADLYKLVHTHPTLTGEIPHIPRVAVLPGPAIPHRLVEFYLQEARTLELSVKVFQDTVSALRWLGSHPELESQPDPGANTGSRSLRN